jgi:toxin-antitoxin system PIN domain toxin
VSARRAAVLLDVNLMIALFDPDHVHHDPAHDWFADYRRFGWATCPVTENGVVRILSNRRYSPIAESPARIVDRLRSLCASGDHLFWADDLSLRDDERFASAGLVTHQKLTDAYLLGLAKQHGGRLATFDRTIPVDAVRGATRDDVLVIAAVSG